MLAVTVPEIDLPLLTVPSVVHPPSCACFECKNGRFFGTPPKHAEPNTAKKAPTPIVRLLRTDKGLTVETALTNDEARDVCERYTGDDDFVRSLVGDYRTYRGKLTPGKLAWLHKKALEFLEREFGGAPAPVPISTVKSFRDILTTLERLAGKRGSVTLRDGGGAVVHIALTSKGQEPGSANVSDGKGFGKGVYFGRIHVGGEYRGNPVVAPMLLALVEDWNAAMTKYRGSVS